MRKLFLVASTLLLLDVVAQFYFAGVGAFHRPFDDEGFSLHAFNALVVQGLSVVTAVIAGFARAGRRTVLVALLPFLLVNVQYAIFGLTTLFVPEGTPQNDAGLPLVVEGPPNFVVALHVINALGILWAAIATFRRARRAVATTAAPGPAPERVTEPAT